MRAQYLFVRRVWDEGSVPVCETGVRWGLNTCLWDGCDMRAQYLFVRRVWDGCEMRAQYLFVRRVWREGSVPVCEMGVRRVWDEGSVPVCETGVRWGLSTCLWDGCEMRVQYLFVRWVWDGCEMRAQYLFVRRVWHEGTMQGAADGTDRLVSLCVVEALLTRHYGRSARCAHLTVWHKRWHRGYLGNHIRCCCSILEDKSNTESAVLGFLREN